MSKASRIPANMLDPFAPTAELAPEPPPAAPQARIAPVVPMVAPAPQPAPAAEPGPEQSDAAEAAGLRPAGQGGARSGRRWKSPTALGPRGYVAGGRNPAPDLLELPPVRVTAYLRPDQYEQLRQEVLRRQLDGRRADISMLLRQAVDGLLGKS